jgi:hypothetical protein
MKIAKRTQMRTLIPPANPARCPVQTCRRLEKRTQLVGRIIAACLSVVLPSDASSDAGAEAPEIGGPVHNLLN